MRALMIGSAPDIDAQLRRMLTHKLRYAVLRVAEAVLLYFKQSERLQ